MYNKVSQELQDKIGRDLKQIYNKDGEEIGMVTFVIQEKEIYEECIEWLETINTYYLSSYWGGSLKKFLHYDYIKPAEVLHYMVLFKYELNWNMSWKDWFIVRGEDNASIVPA